MSFFRNLFRPMADNRLTSAEFKSRLTDADVVLDVRTPAEYAEGHLVQARNIDVMNPTFVDHVQDLDKDKTYYLHCKSGGRSGKATEIMRGMGFDAYNVGGYADLVAAGFESKQ
ncbi:MAG: rhodanese-like domain-containing protein [Rhodothermales bacterium]